MLAGLLLIGLLLAAPAWAQDQQDIDPTINNWGGAGLVDMPSARMRHDGELSLGTVLSERRQSLSFAAQFLPWLELVGRIESTPQAELFGGRLADRAFDLKLRLWREDDWRPALALGFRDLGGDGPGSAEYLVASKRFWDLDVSAGLGWGRLGTRGDASNPLALGNAFPQAQHRRVAGPFTGREVGFFGGLEWRLPDIATPWGGINGLRLVGEVTADALRDAAAGYPAGPGTRRVMRSRLAGGITWPERSGMEAGLVFVNGTDLLLRLSWRLQPDKPLLPDPDTPPPMVAALAEPVPGAEVLIAQALTDAGFRPAAVEIGPRMVLVAVDSLPHRSLAQAAGRVMRAAQPFLPPGVEMLRLEWRRRGVVLARLDLPRREFAAAAIRRGSAEEIYHAARLLPAERQAPFTPWPVLGWFLAPQVLLLPGDRQAALRGQVAVGAGLRLSLPAGFALAGSVRQVLASNIGSYHPPASGLPPVRSDLPRYASEGTTAIASLYAEGMWNTAPDLFARVTAGLLEPMYAGAMAEWLWRPIMAPAALGLDLAWLRQRDEKQRFGLRDYQTITGHLSLHADLPWWHLHGVLRGGRYLAGDWGGTVELSRRFDSGIEVGGFVTMTEAANRASGPRGVDQGVFLRLPLPWQMATPTATAGMLYRPVIRDAGQRLQPDHNLYDLVRDGRAEAFRRGHQDLLR